MVQQLIWAILLLFSGFVMGHLYGSHQHSVETPSVANQQHLTIEWPQDDHCRATTASAQTSCRLALLNSATQH